MLSTVCFISMTHLFCSWSLHLILSLLFHSTLPPPLLWQPPVCSLCLWICFCSAMYICFVLDSTCKWNHDIFTSLLDLFDLLSRFIYVVKNSKISFFVWLSNMLHYLDILYYLNIQLILNMLWKDWCWSWNSNTLATWWEKQTHWRKPWCWERLKVGGEGDDRGWDGWMASLTWWTWVWVSSWSWWWTGKPGVLQTMGSQRVRHDWVTELNWREHPC